MIRVGTELQERFDLSSDDIKTIYTCLIKSGYTTMKKLKNALKKKTIMCVDGDEKIELDNEIVKVLITSYNKLLKNKPMKGGSNGLSSDECSNMTLKQIKKTSFYKNLPRSVNKSKLNKITLCKLLERICEDERDAMGPTPSPTPVIKDISQMKSERVTIKDKNSDLREKLQSKFNIDLDNKKEIVDYLKKNILTDIEYRDLMEFYGIARSVDAIKEKIKMELKLIK